LVFMPGRRKSRSRSRQPERRRKQKAESEAGSDVTGQNEDEDMSPEARIALLEVENETLKAENRGLRKKLVEALKRTPAKEQASGERKRDEKKSRREASPKRREASPKRREASPKRKEASPRRKEASPRRKEASPKRGKATKDKSEPREEEDGEMPAWAEENEEDASKPNAVLLVNPAMEAYNEEIPNNQPLEKRLPMVEAKMGRFLENFGDNISIMDLKSGGTIIKDRKTFKMRYGCVFRESGASLKVTTNKRFYFDASGKKATYCLDFEKHESLVTPTPGTRPDGSLGCRPPREEHLVVLYEEQVGKITRMWLASDADKVGQDPFAGEEVLLSLPVYKQFEKKIAELKGAEKAGEYFFNNYHNIPTVG